VKTRTARFSTIKTVTGHLVEDPTAMQVMAHATEVLKAGRIYQLIVPPSLARVSRVANLKAGVVIVHAEHGAAANKLKQQATHLIEDFVRKGFECSGIEIRVQPSPIKETEMLATNKPLSERALTSLAETAQKMRDGSPLKAKIEHLIQHVARRE
jgi:hypothetical protein